ncbi:MAG: 3-methylfumaryl-CoA hydratase [Actinomycetia bacterium]|nr:3-methylfumaryl-CoA hydratase [Actinomycetes bacterium]
MSLADSLADWRPGAVEMARSVDPWPAAAFAGLIGAPEPALKDGDPLPPMWHWFTLLEHPATAEIGPDGHPKDGHFLPPIPGRRRMFAGGRLHVHAPIPVGSLLSSRSEVANIAIKSGRSGEMAFVTVRTELAANGVLAAVEEQDIVYRSAPAQRDSRGSQVGASGGPQGRPPAGEWRCELATDPVLLFRFSALTYNGHRIHYDLPYATGEEGYPGLVIHGPLLALLALDLPRVHAPGATLTSFEYRLVRPAFAPATVVAAGQPPHDGIVELTVSAAGAEPSLTATAVLE